MQAQATVAEEEQVPRMRIGMEYAGAEELMHVGIEQCPCQRGRGRRAVRGLQAGPVASILHQHGAAGDIGEATGRDKGWPYVSSLVVAVTLKQNKATNELVNKVNLIE